MVGMSDDELRKELETIHHQLEGANPAVQSLYNLVERLADENALLRQEIEALRREVEAANSGKTTEASSQKSATDGQQVNTEKHRQAEDQKNRSSRKTDARTFKPLQVHETVPCPVDPSLLPPDARRFADERVVVQDLVIRPHNICYEQEVWYSPSQRQYFYGELPDAAGQHFGAALRSTIVALKYVGQTSEPNLLEFLASYGVQISAGSISNILLRTAHELAREKEDLVRAGLQSTGYQQLDDTSARVAGQFWHTHVLCNEYYTAFFTRPRKDRLTVLEVLQNAASLRFVLDEATLGWLKEFGVAAKWQAWARQHQNEQIYDRTEWEALLDRAFGKEHGGVRRDYFNQAGALSYYHQQTDWPIPEVLLSDDADQFKRITERVALCWIHEGRHYEKLQPRVPLHQEQLDKFRRGYWYFYRRLQDYRAGPEDDEASELQAEFDALFATRTGYAALDARIALTQEKRSRLLVVLACPSVPLHNNTSELGARVCARRRDVSLHSKSVRGASSMDLFNTIVQTAKKLGVSCYHYLFDRISGTFAMPSLADLILQQSAARTDPRPELLDASV
jgi:hypothetical protein